MDVLSAPLHEAPARKWVDFDIDLLSTYHVANNALRRFFMFVYFIFTIL
jgi:hypothetical protein